MEFDTAKYTELAAQGMSNIDIFKEMEWDRSMTSFRDAAIRTGVYVRDPSGSQTKKARLTAAETELAETPATENAANAAMPAQVKRDSEEQFVTIRIPAKKRDYGYRGIELRRDDIHKAVELLTDAILSAMDDIAELLGEENVERVQAYIDRSVEKAAKE